MNSRYTKIKAALFFIVVLISCTAQPLCASPEQQPIPSENSTKQEALVDAEAEKRARTIALHIAVIEEMSVRAMQIIRKHEGDYPTKCLDHLAYYLPKVKEVLHKNLLPTWAHRNFVALNDYTREILLRRGGLTRLNVRHLRDAYGQLIAELNKCITVRSKEQHLDTYASDDEKEALTTLRSALCGAYVLLTKEDMFPYGGLVGWYKYLWETERIKACIGGAITLAAALGGLFFTVQAVRDKIESDEDKQRTVEKDYQPFEKSLNSAIKMLKYVGKEKVSENVSKQLRECLKGLRECLEELRMEQQKNGWRRDALEKFKKSLYKHPRLRYWLTYAQLRGEGANVDESLHLLNDDIASVICPRNDRSSLKNDQSLELTEIQYYKMLQPLLNGVGVIEGVIKDSTTQANLVSKKYKEDPLNKEYDEQDYRVLVCWVNANPDISLAYVYWKKIEEAIKEPKIEEDVRGVMSGLPFLYEESKVISLKLPSLLKESEDSKVIKGYTEKLKGIFEKVRVIQADKKDAEAITKLLDSAKSLVKGDAAINNIIDKPFSPGHVTNPNNNILKELDEPQLIETYLYEITDKESCYKKWYQQPVMKDIVETSKAPSGALKKFLKGRQENQVGEPDMFDNLKKVLVEEKDMIAALIVQKERDRIALNKAGDGSDELNRPEVVKLIDDIDDLKSCLIFLTDLIERLGYKKEWSFTGVKEDREIEKLKKQYTQTFESFLKNFLKSKGVNDNESPLSYEESLKNLYNDLLLEVESVNLANGRILAEAQLIEGIHELAYNKELFNKESFSLKDKTGEDETFFKKFTEKFIEKSLHAARPLTEGKRLLVADTFLLYEILKILCDDTADWTAQGQQHEQQNNVAKKILEEGKLKSNVCKTPAKCVCNPAIKSCFEKLIKGYEAQGALKKVDHRQFAISERNRIKKIIDDWKIIVNARVSDFVKWYVLSNLPEGLEADANLWKDEKAIVAKFFEAHKDTFSESEKIFFEDHMRSFVINQESDENIAAYVSKQKGELQQNAPITGVVSSIIDKDDDKSIKTLLDKALPQSSYARVKPSLFLELYIMRKLDTIEELADEELLKRLPQGDTFNEGEKRCALTIIYHLRCLERKKPGSCAERKYVLEELTKVCSDNDLLIDDTEQGTTEAEMRKNIETVKTKLDNAKVFTWGVGKDAFQSPFDVSTLNGYTWPKYKDLRLKIIGKNGQEVLVTGLEEACKRLIPSNKASA